MLNQNHPLSPQSPAPTLAAPAWRVFHTVSPDETMAIGKALGTCLANGSTVPIHGDLGAGKTLLCRGIARGRGVDEPVTSPTFNIVQEYRCADGAWLFHLDMYRINNETAAIAFGIDEYLFAADAVTLIEWPERIEQLLYALPDAADTPPIGLLVPIWIEHAGENQRIIRLPARIADQMDLDRRTLS